MGLSKGVLLCFLQEYFKPTNNKVLESLCQSLLIAEVTPKRLGTLQIEISFAQQAQLPKVSIPYNRDYIQVGILIKAQKSSGMP